MADPLSDPRAQQLLSAQTDEVASLASAFRKVAGQAQTSAAGLRGARGDATWTGAAATAFRGQVGKLPGDLDKVQHSYGEVAGALSYYETQLGPLQSQFRSLATQLQTAQSNLGGAQNQLSNAQTNLSSATSAPHAKSTTPAVVNARSALQTASGNVGHLQGEVSGLQTRGFHILDEFDTVRGQARSRVSSAAGIAPSQGWFSGLMHDIGDFMSGAGHFFKSMALDVADAAERLPSDVAHVIEHPTDLHDWSQLGEDVGTVAGAVALVAAVAICPADALGFEAFAEGAEAVEGFASGAAVYSTEGKTAADSVLVAEGKESPSELGSDALSLAIGHIAPGEDDANEEVTNLTGKSDALESYAYSRALGASPKEAYSDLSDDQRWFLSKSVKKLSDPGRLSYMRSSTAEELEGAEQHLHLVKAGNELWHEVADHGKNEIKDKLFPEPKGAAA